MRAVLAALLAACWLAACGHGQVGRVEDGRHELGPGEGFLVLHTDVDFRFDRVSIGDAWFDAPHRGADLQILVVPAGEYRWEEFGMGVMRWTMDDDEPSFDFHVVAGKLNYPGQLLAESAGVFEGRFYTRNRSATVLRELSRRFPRIYRRYPLVYTGFQPDPFYAYYRSLKPDWQLCDLDDNERELDREQERSDAKGAGAAPSDEAEQLRRELEAL